MLIQAPIFFVDVAWNIIKQIWYGGKRSVFQIWQIIVTKLRKLSPIGL